MSGEKKTTEQILYENSIKIQEQFDAQNKMLEQMAAMIETLTANDEKTEITLAEVKKAYEDTRKAVDAARNETIAQGDRIEEHTTEGFKHVDGVVKENASELQSIIENHTLALANAVNDHVQMIKGEMDKNAKNQERATISAGRNAHRY